MAQPSARGEEAGARDRICPRPAETGPALSGVDQTDPGDPGLRRSGRGAVMASGGPDGRRSVARRVPPLSPADRADHRANRTSRPPWRGGRGQREHRRLVRVPHADIIVKGGRDIQYGHKLNLTTGRSGLILDFVIEAGNPADSERFLPMLERHIALSMARCLDRQPLMASFASRDNLAQAKALGVHDVAFHKKAGLRVKDMVKSNWVYRKLRNFRAGVEFPTFSVPEARLWPGALSLLGVASTTLRPMSGPQSSPTTSVSLRVSSRPDAFPPPTDPELG